MYCKICGAEINSTDLFCRACGTKIEELSPEGTISSEEPKHEDFTWNIYEFPKPRRTEEIDFQWNLNALKEKKQQEENLLKKEEFLKSEESNSQQEVLEKEEPNEPIEETKIVWEIPKKEALPSDIVVSNFSDLPGAEVKKEIAEKITETAEAEIPEKDLETNEAEKFFTFSKKNEEFQQLLDREYEKIRKKNRELPSLKESHLSTVMEPPELPQKEKEAVFAEEAEKTEDDTKRVDLKAIKKTCEEAFKSSACIPAQPLEETKESESEAEMAGRLAAHANHLGEMIAARASFFAEIPEPVCEAEEKELAQIPTSGPSETIVGPNTEVLVTVEVKSNGKSETVTRQTIAMDGALIAEAARQGAMPEKKPLPLSVTLDEREADFAKAVPVKEEINIEEVHIKEDKPEKLPFLEKIQEEKLTDIENDEKIQDAEIEVEAQEEPEKRELPDLDNTLSQEDLTKFWQMNTFGMEEKKKVNIPKIALGVIAALLVLEIGALGIQFFFPKSAAAQGIYSVQSKVVQAFSKVGDDITSVFQSDKNEKEQKEDRENKDEEQEEQEVVPEEPNPLPMSDKNALIESQLINNKNIQVVSKADSLLFNETRDYGVKDLNKSTPIDNNIWYTGEDGVTVYYDQAVVGTLISFNSQWIDYVNKKDESILSLLKPKSRAYNNVASFSKAGKITEVFESFSIGEIRKGEKGYYVFTEEQIKKTEKGKDSMISNHWIYYLEPVEQKMMIVNYF